MDRRSNPGNSRTASSLHAPQARRSRVPKTSKTPQGWSMAMVDFERKQSKTLTVQKSQKENKKLIRSTGTTLSPKKRNPSSKAAGGDSHASSASGGSAAAVWNKVEATGTVPAYWWNVETKETSWTPPKKGKKKKKKKMKPSKLALNMTSARDGGVINDYE